MAARTIRYHVGNEHSPTDPWGRSELVIQADGTARLDHVFSRSMAAAAWTGRVDASALEELWAALATAGFPEVPAIPMLPPDSTVRRLTVEADDISAEALVSWHQAPSLPGYAEAFDVIDGVIRQLSGDTVTYPTSQPQIVRGVARASEKSARPEQ